MGRRHVGFVPRVAQADITSGRWATCVVLETLPARSRAVGGRKPTRRHSEIGSLISWMKWFAPSSAAFFSAAFLSAYSNIASRFIA